jgi:hypothetical protein
VASIASTVVAISTAWGSAIWSCCLNVLRSWRFSGSRRSAGWFDRPSHARVLGPATSSRERLANLQMEPPQAAQHGAGAVGAGGS